MNSFDQFIDPTRVTHSASCYFTSLQRKNLVVVKNTLLQIFQINTDSKLILIDEFKLNGSISGIKAIKLSTSPYEQLLVLTNLAKLSLISWDFDNHTIITQSLHYYELEFQTKSINQHEESERESQLRVDPNGYCSLAFLNDLFAFLPFKQINDDLGDDQDIYEINDPSKQDTSTDFFESSIIVPVTQLEPTITSIIDCEFLYNYRDPTLAILHNKNLSWASDLSIRKDTVSLTVLSLDLTTGTSTPIINLENLPFDLYYIKALSSPLSGCLLIGCNEIVHVDNSGNIKGIGVNQYYQETSDLKLNDQSDLNLFLEDSQLEILSSNKALLIDTFGVNYILKFELDGKTIKDLSLHRNEVDLKISNPLSITGINPNEFFIGAGSSDSVLIKLQQEKITQNGPKKISEEKEDDLYGDDDDDDDDLYDLKDESQDLTGNNTVELQITDFLINNGPIGSFTLGKTSPEPLIQGLENPNYKDSSIIATTGEEKFGRLTILKPTVQPNIHSTLKFNNINRIWNVANKYLITTDLANFKSEIFLINENFKNFQSLDFKNSSITINISTVFNGTRILLVSSTNLYLFDLNFKKILQVNVDFEIIKAKIFDPYVLITSSQGEIKIFEIDAKGKRLNKVKLPKILSDLILTSGNISSTSILNTTSKRKLDDSTIDNKNIIFLVTTVNNQVFAFNKSHEEKVYEFSNLDKLFEISNLTPYDELNTKGLVPDPFIKEIELVELGDETSSEELLTILTIGGEIIFYKLWKDISGSTKFIKILNPTITGAPENIYPESTILERKLIPLKLGSKRLLIVTGRQPYLITKTSKSKPKIHKFTSSSLISICFFRENNDKFDKFMYIDNLKNARICSLNDSINHDYSNNLPIERVLIGETINNVTFHETSNLVVLSTLTKFPYSPKDEEGNDIVGLEEGKPKSYNYKSNLKLINPSNWLVIDEIEYEENDVVNDIKSTFLTISSRSKKKKEFIVYGIGKYRLEDLSVYGNFHIQDIISIVPDPSKPHVTHKFKEIFQEFVKGAVTKVCEISGRFLISQGAKILIRDLQQDNSTVPVAFFDTATYIFEAKSFGNLLLIGDTLKSLWFFGFDAEPYRLLLLGKDLQNLSVSSADFIVDNGDLQFLIADSNENLHIVSYDPDDPKSLSGQKLLKKTVFKNNSITTCLKLIPVFKESEETNSFQNIGSNIDGSFFKITPINEESYRRLYILQQQISEKFAHFAGLNPKANRFSDLEIGAKPIIEISLIRDLFVLFNVEKRLQFSRKVGKNAYLEIWRDFIEIDKSLNL